MIMFILLERVKKSETRKSK